MKTWLSDLRMDRLPSESAVRARSTSRIAGGAELAHHRFDGREPFGGGELGDDRTQCGFVGVGRRDRHGER